MWVAPPRDFACAAELACAIDLLSAAPTVAYRNLAGMRRIYASGSPGIRAVLNNEQTANFREIVRHA
jgi:hypothetical protein